MDLELYPHQEKAVRELANGKVLWGGVGTGKSRTAVAYYLANEAPKDIYVITTAKKRDSLDWDGEFLSAGIGKDYDATFLGKLTVDSWNNLGKYENCKNEFFIFDEQRLVGNGAWVKSFLRIAKNNRWILLSATPGDTWLDYIPVFLANGFYKNRTEFKREHVVYNTFSKFPKVDRFIGVSRLVRNRNKILVEMPFVMPTTRKLVELEVDYDKELYRRVVKDRWNVYENKPLRDVSQLFSAMRKVVNSDPSRLRMVSSLLEKHPKLIVFYNFDYELDLLRTLAGTMSSVHSSHCLMSSVSAVNPQSIQNLGESVSTPSTQSSVCGCTNQEVAEWNEEKTPRSHGMRSSLLKLKVDSIIQAKSRSFSEPDTQDNSESLSSLYENTSKKDFNNDSGPRIAGRLSEKLAHGTESREAVHTQTASKLTVAEWNGHKHEKIPAGDNWLYLVQYMAGSEGWNCTETDAMCFYSLTYSYKNFHQAQGRIDRLNTPFKELYYYVLSSKAPIDLAVRKSLRAKRNFNESEFKL